MEIKNAWILTVIFITISYVPMFLHSKGRKRLSDFSWINKQGKYLSWVIMILFITYLVLPLFYDITTDGTQKYMGISIFLIGILGILTSYYNYFTTDIKQLITKGLYQLSRNPIYLFSIISFLGIAILCSSYTMFVILFIYSILQHPIIKEEERFCRKKYGKEYNEYVKKVRRYL